MGHETSTVLPFAVAQWANEEWVSARFADAGLSAADILTFDPSKPISGTGCSMLGWVALCPHRPSLDATREVMRYFLEDRGCDPNVPDHYGRTPLVHFLRGYSWWMDKLEYGLEGIKLLLVHGADANVLFTPNYVSEVHCNQWRLVHHCIYSHILDLSHEIAAPVLELLEPHWDKTLKDSENRGIEEYEALPKVAWRRKQVRNASEIHKLLDQGKAVFAMVEQGMLSARVQVLRPCPNPLRFIVRSEDGAEEHFPAGMIQLLA